MAWRNIWRNKSRSLTIIASVVIGLVAGLFILALYKGMLVSRMRIVIDQEASHLQLHHPKFKNDFDPAYVLPITAKEIESIRNQEEVSTIALRSIVSGMLSTATGTSGVQIIGVDPQEENAVTKLNKKIIEGSDFIEGKRNQILIGKKLADKMKLHVGSKLVLTFSDPDANIASGAFRIAGIYRSNNAPLDETIVYVKRENLNTLLNTNDKCHEIAILLKSDNLIFKTESFLQSRFRSVKVESWEEISPETRLMIDTTDLYSIIFIVIIMLALAFGIVNTMLMAVLERTREFGMLISIGMNRLKVFILVLLETTLLTLTGVPIGIGIAWLTIASFSKRGIDLSSTASETMSSFGFDNVIYPLFPQEQILIVINIVLITAMISSLFPSLKAMKLQPVDAMRK